jgi:3-dehydroquinate dehydratase I
MTDHPTTPSRPGGRICVAVAAPDTDSALATARPIRHEVDVAEIRIDAMREVNLARLNQQAGLPLLITNRPVWEGGACRTSEEERLHPLLEAVAQEAAYIDLELKTALPLRQRLLKKISGSPTKLIISSHDFEQTPDASRLAQTLLLQRQSGAHIGKIVTMAHDHLDVLRVLNLQCEAKELGFPLIAFCMGEQGKLSRIITLLLGGYMTYAAPDEQQATAPGQLSVRGLKAALEALAGAWQTP